MEAARYVVVLGDDKKTWHALVDGPKDELQSLQKLSLILPLGLDIAEIKLEVVVVDDPRVECLRWLTIVGDAATTVFFTITKECRCCQTNMCIGARW